MNSICDVFSRVHRLSHLMSHKRTNNNNWLFTFSRFFHQRHDLSYHQRTCCHNLFPHQRDNKKKYHDIIPATQNLQNSNRHEGRNGISGSTREETGPDSTIGQVGGRLPQGISSKADTRNQVSSVSIILSVFVVCQKKKVVVSLSGDTWSTCDHNWLSCR